MMDNHCGNCKYCGEVLKDNLHSCNNNKSIFKVCLETATGCEKFEPQERSDKEKLSWLGKNCKDCGNEKCKKLGTLSKGYDCALWQGRK